MPKFYGNGEQQKRISDELRLLKQMSKGLRTRALRSLLERHAAQRLAAKRALLPVKASSPIAA